jgi:hypothetical protein
VSDPPSAEFLSRLQPIPTYRDHPATAPSDFDGVTPDGTTVTIAVVDSVDPVLLLFLSATCLGCLDLWAGTAALRAGLPEGLRIVIVAKGPEDEDADAIGALAPAGTEVVMSSAAYRHYRVGGAPFLVVVVGHEVRTEGVAWGVAETTRATRHALEGVS